MAANTNSYIQDIFQLLELRHPGKTLYHVIGSDSVAKYPETQRENYQAGRRTLLNLRDADDPVPIDILTSPFVISLQRTTYNYSSTEIRVEIGSGRSHPAIVYEVRTIVMRERLYFGEACAAGLKPGRGQP